MFKKKGDFLWNFRCPYCGDSQKSRTKARGFVYRKKNDLFYKCHNCGVGTTLGGLIKYVDSKIHKDYILERYKTGSDHQISKPEFEFNEPVFRKKGLFKNLQKHRLATGIWTFRDQDLNMVLITFWDHF